MKRDLSPVSTRVRVKNKITGINISHTDRDSFGTIIPTNEMKKKRKERKKDEIAGKFMFHSVVEVKKEIIIRTVQFSVR